MTVFQFQSQSALIQTSLSLTANDNGSCITRTFRGKEVASKNLRSPKHKKHTSTPKHTRNKKNTASAPRKVLEYWIPKPRLGLDTWLPSQKRNQRLAQAPHHFAQAASPPDLERIKPEALFNGFEKHYRFIFFPIEICVSCLKICTIDSHCLFFLGWRIKLKSHLGDWGAIGVQIC